MKRLYTLSFGVRLLLLAAFTASFITVYRPGLVEAYHGTYALYFDGTNSDEVGLAQGAVMFGSDCYSQKAVTVWYKPTGNAPTVGSYVEGDLIVGGRPSWWGIYRANVSDQDRLWFWNWDENRISYAISTSYTVGEWVHLGLVHQGGYLKAYKNGVLIGNIATGDTGGATCQQIMIGGMTAGPGTIKRVEGYIDEVAYWDIPPTQDMIRSWMYRELDSSHPNWSGLAGYYKMSNGSGTSLTDDGPNSYTGTLVGLPDWVASSAFSGPRSALDFDGIDDSASIPTAANLDLSGNVTFEGWINSVNWNNGQDTPFLVKGDGTSPEINYYFGKNSLGQLVFRYGNTSPVSVSDTSGVSYSDGIWYHIAIVVDVSSSQVLFYRDGRLLSTIPHTFSTLPSNGYPLTLAAYPNSTDSYFIGQVDEWRLWSSTRTESQIRSSMADTLSGTEPGLVAYYRFDQPADASETVLEDVSPNNLDGSLLSMLPASDWVGSSAFNSWTGVISSDWNNEQNWSRNLVPAASDNISISADYASAIFPTLNNAAAAHNLVVESGARLNVGSSGELTATENLYNMGTLQQEKNVSGSSAIGFFNTGFYGGVLINPNGDDLGATTVTIRGLQSCTGLNSPVRRCFEIAPTNQPTVGTSLTFFYDDIELNGNSCSTLGVYRWTGGSWESQSISGRQCSLKPSSVSIQDVTSFSPFVLESSSPTAISLKSFSASVYTPSLLTYSFLVILALLISGVTLRFCKDLYKN